MTVIEISSAIAPNDLGRWRWTSADLELFPENGKRYEIIDGELFVTRAPHWQHQRTCGNLHHALHSWSKSTGLGYVAMGAGVILGDNDDVIPDVVWVSKDRYHALIDQAGHLLGAPELVIEVLSAGKEQERRDRQLKLKLYSNHGVMEYWIADWRSKQIEVYRREGGVLQLEQTLGVTDTLTSPLLPNFACSLGQIFE
jgi:Uma2 family endonuclease